MRNTGILLVLVGIYIVINSGSFRDLVKGTATLGFMNPKSASTSSSPGGGTTTTTATTSGNKPVAPSTGKAAY